MKKLGAFLVGVSLVAGIAVAANTATSVNIVGFNKITCPRGKFVLVSTAFRSVNGSVMKAPDVFGDNLPIGASIYAYDAQSAGYIIDNNEESGWTTNITFKGGMGFWISVPADAVDPSYTVTLNGEVPLDSVISNKVYNGFTMLGYPYAATVAWTNTVLAKNAQIGDSLYVYNPTNGYTSYNMEEGGWSDPSLIINLGLGFWYQTGSAAYTNLEVRPYNP